MELQIFLLHLIAFRVAAAGKKLIKCGKANVEGEQGAAAKERGWLHNVRQFSFFFGKSFESVDPFRIVGCPCPSATSHI